MNLCFVFNCINLVAFGMVAGASVLEIQSAASCHAKHKSNNSVFQNSMEDSGLISTVTYLCGIRS